MNNERRMLEAAKGFIASVANHPAEGYVSWQATAKDKIISPMYSGKQHTNLTLNVRNYKLLVSEIRV